MGQTNDHNLIPKNTGFFGEVSLLAYCHLYARMYLSSAFLFGGHFLNAESCYRAILVLVWDFLNRPRESGAQALWSLGPFSPLNVPDVVIET